ncbi:unnamed protein product [Adineta steineri]|uniref:Uncharacterized protein n=2 Tax=Adineta steineri TaxID=433720 RepID=A0A819YIV6_9BILA|nr:unnamed protein product [Adineta steineri]CAF4157540.1 unnamed protein product [Adineta steineri]
MKTTFFFCFLVTPFRSTNITLTLQAKWSSNGIIVAGRRNVGNKKNQLYWPQGLYIDENQTIYVADLGNDRIVSWRLGDTDGQVVVGGNEQKNQSIQLKNPADVIVDRENNNLIFCDEINKQVVRWSRHSGVQGAVVVPNIACRGLTMDSGGLLYVADMKNHEVRRWRLGDSQGKRVAGGNRHGKGTDQLDTPSHLFVDRNGSVYVSDRDNHRVMKWAKGAKKGQWVAGDQTSGNSNKQLNTPEGVVVDEMGTVYVADYGNNRIMRWPQNAVEGSVVAGNNGVGSALNQLNGPIGLTFDRYGHIYVADSSNHRVLKFELISP